MKALKIDQQQFNNLFKNSIIPFANVILTNGTANFENNLLEFIVTKSLKVNVGSYQNNDVSFNFGSLLDTTSNSEGQHFFSFAVQNKATNRPNFTLVASVVINGAQPIELECEIDGQNPNFQTFAQVLYMQRSDTFSVTFKVLKDASSPFNSFSFNLDGFCLSPNVNGDYIPKGYVSPNNATGYQSRVDELNIITLTESIENAVVITGTVEENGGLILMDSNSKITPINVGDVVQIDFACTFVTPSGIDNYVAINLSVDGIIYRSVTHQLIKGSGNNDTISISWCLPVGEFFKLNGALITINPSDTMTYKDRYIQATRIHKAR